LLRTTLCNDDRPAVYSFRLAEGPSRKCRTHCRIDGGASVLHVRRALGLTPPRDFVFRAGCRTEGGCDTTIPRALELLELDTVDLEEINPWSEALRYLGSWSAGFRDVS
jgi:hypothetical protein